MEFSFETRATNSTRNTPDSRIFTRCRMVRTVAVRRQTIVLPAETALRQHSNAARSSTARATRERLTPRDAYFLQTDRRLRYITVSLLPPDGTWASPNASRSIAAWVRFCSARMSDASPRTLLLPAPIEPVMMSNDLCCITVQSFPDQHLNRPLRADSCLPHTCCRASPSDTLTSIFFLLR